MVAAAQVVAPTVEFTCTLLVGPPTIFRVALPLTSKECEHLGFSTMMGIGALASCNPHTAKARTSVARLPVSRPLKYTADRSVTSTRMKGEAAMLPGGAVTPGTEPGKLTATWATGVLATSVPPVYPFRVA